MRENTLTEEQKIGIEKFLKERQERVKRVMSNYSLINGRLKKMKKIIPILLACASLCACNRCEECTTTSTITETTTSGWGSGQTVTRSGASTTFEACGSDRREVDGKTTTSTSTTPTTIITTVTTTKCK